MSSSTAAGFGTGMSWEDRRDMGFGGLPGFRAAGILARAQRLVGPLLREAVESVPDEIRVPIGYHFGWWDADGVAALGETGKGLRPALVLAAAEAAGGEVPGAVHAAAAVELVHNFTLIHDDIMDGAQVRRGRPTVWSLWGVDDAVLAGDVLHSLAIWTLAGAPVAALAGIARLEDSVIELCLGQQYDCAFETTADVTVDECLKALRHKGSALMGCACALGALCAEAPPDVVEELDHFGREIGAAFQLMDDVMGIWGDPARTGKPVGSDLLQHKRSLPIVAALHSATPEGREFAELYESNQPLDGPAVAHAADLIERAGGKGWAQAESVRHVRAAKSCLAEYDDAGDLLELADSVIHRDR
ncbi:polyprenyl synthetase family protein [Nocardia sp. NPDC051030]|uniref:polyprenyl synthetase family protein n=1 Tax=Nocardia sp. NPDC051030 TaxID=3155162 RepID=UPI0034255F9F